MDETVTVEFNPPVTVASETDCSWTIQSDEVSTHLPKKHVAPLGVNESYGELAMPRWLAVDRGFIEGDDTSFPSKETSVGLTRYDLFQAVAFHAFLVQGDSIQDASWEATKAADYITRGDDDGR